MTAVRGAFSYLLAPGMRKIFFMAWKDRPEEFSQFMHVGSMDRAYVEDFEMAGFGPMSNISEGGSIIYADVQQGNKKRYTALRYGSGFRVTEDLMDDDLYSQISRAPKALAKSARNTVEQLAANILINGFVTTYNSSFDGAALFSTAHTALRTGTAAANKPTVDLDLSLPALQAAVEHFQNLLNNEGMPMLMVPKKVIIPASGAYWWTANQLLKSTQLPGGNDNDINQLAREGLSIFQSHYLTDTDAWFVQADEHDLQWLWRKKPRCARSWQETAQY
jgi:hypothetical protein